MTLREYLEKEKISQTSFAKLIGKSQSLVSAYCTGGLVPPRATALKIVKVTKGALTLSDLWGVKVA